jgi:hypothetical protein
MADVVSAVRVRAQAALDWLKHAGVSMDGVERAFDYCRDYGLFRALAIVILVLTPIVKFVWLPWMGSRIVTTIADTYGLDLEVGDWNGSLWDLRATAEDVVLKARGQHAREHLARADAITIDLGFFRWIGGHGWVKTVVVDEPTVHLERSLSGRWNWQDLADVDAGTSSVRISTLRLDRLRIEWIEHVPGNSGGGVVNTSRATLYVDDANVLLQDVVLPADSREKASRFTLNGRTADGVLSVDGAANFFRFRDRASAVLIASAVAGAAPGTGWAPVIEASVYLENIGAAAIGQMLARGPLQAAGGTISGRIALALDDAALTCTTDLQLKDVAYAPNAGSMLLRGHTDVLRGELQGFRSTRRVQVGCEGAQEGAGYRPLQALQAAVTRQAVADAAPAVRQAALIDERHATGEISDADLKVMGDRVARTAGRALADDFGAAAERAIVNRLTPRGTSGQAADPVTRGVRSVGRGLKRLFTKDKK